MTQRNLEGLPLRQVGSAAAIMLSLMTITVAIALVLLTTGLHETSATLRDTVRGVHLTREAQTDLLLFERSRDPAERATLETKLRQMLAEDFGYTPDSPEAKLARDEAERRVAQYLAPEPENEGLPGATVDLEAALDALESVAHTVLVDANQARARAAYLDTLANSIALVATLLMAGVLAGVGLWMQRSVVRPVLALTGAMDRFCRGTLAARASPHGAAEIRKMMRQFNDMGDALQRQQDTRLAHLAGVAHDLRNPLAALQMSAALVDPERRLPPEPTVRRALALVRRQVARLVRMVDDLLDAAQIDAGRLTLKPRDMDLREAVQDVVALFKEVSERHTLEVDFSDEPIVIRCDPWRIEQTLSNLVSNAIKYSPRGGGVRIRACREGQVVKIAVSDEGVGIAPADMDRIWEPFRRTGLSSEAIPGVGLGLWTAQRIAEAHQGTILVESVAGKGATFTLVLPLTAPMAPAQEPIAPPLIVSSTAPEGSHG